MSEKDNFQIGVVKWFGNKKTDALYGFIYCPQLGDIFVHENNTNGKIQEHDIVFFTVEKSKSKEGKLIANNVKMVDKNNGQYELLKCYLFDVIDDEYERYFQNKIFEFCGNPDLDLDESSQRLLDIYIENKINDYYAKVKRGEFHLGILGNDFNLGRLLFKITQLFSQQHELYLQNPVSTSLIKYFNNTHSKYVKLLGWFSGTIQVINDEILYEALRNTHWNDKIKLFELAKNQNLEKMIEVFIDSFVEEPTQKQFDDISNNYYDWPTFTAITKIYEIINNTNSELSHLYLDAVYAKCSINLKSQLWLAIVNMKFTNEISIFIAERFLTFNYQFIPKIVNRFNSLSDNELDLLFETFMKYEIPKLNGINIRLLIEGIRSKPKIYERLVEASPQEYQLELWCYNKLDKLDISIIENAFPGVNEDIQVKTIQKLFYYYGEKTKSKLVLFLNSVIKSLSNEKCSFELFLVLYVLLQKINESFLDFQNLTEYALKALGANNNFYILHDTIGDTTWLQVDYNCKNLLEYCTGRSNEDQGRIIKSTSIPHSIVFCEGKLSPNKSKNSNLNFYWCRNLPCFASEIHKRTIISWDKLKLFDILSIIDANLSEDSYSYLLGILNKLYQYIPHLKCRSCDSWLVPNRQSNYAYYRVNHFVCANDKCADKGKEIYLSHCLNPKCVNVIDSRNSVKCSHSWYICDYCLSCCTTKKLQTKKDITIQTGQYYAGADKGHDETNQIFCPKCGNEIQYKEIQKESIIVVQGVSTYNVRVLQCSNEKCQFSIELGNCSNERLWALRQHHIINNFYRE